jgi:putative ribosome biogenesis GTPase RsgA
LYGGESVQNIVQVSESVRHVTTALNRLRLADLSKNNNNLTDVRIIDSWGVTAQNYNEVFLNLIKGMLPPKYKMVKNENIQQDLVTVDMLPQCVLFCITAADLESKSDFCQIIQRYINICVSSDIAPMLLITKIDESPSISIIQRSNLTVSNAPVKPLIDQARSLFGLNENLIIPVINYRNESRKSFETDRWVFRALDTAINLAKSRAVLQSSNSNEGIYS